MELYQIRSFIAVADALNLTRAARNTHQSPSAVSAQIKALEAELGIALFRRSTRGMTLTQEGEVLLASAKKLDRVAGDITREAERLRQTLQGNLNIGINTDPGYLKLSGLTRWIAEHLPNISLTFIETQTFTTPELLAQGRIDLGFHFGEFGEPEIYSQPVSGTRVRVVLPASLAKGHVHTDLETLVALPWVWTRHACPFHQAFQRRLDNAGLTLTATADAVDEKIVEELVKSGTGAALMRDDQSRTLVDNGHAVYWEGPGETRDTGDLIPLGLACLKARRPERRIAAFFKAAEVFWENEGAPGVSELAKI
ncbi:MAG: LysR family transcriptional regulator [Desulfobacterales bacterium]|nr:LysR family transcriptional regulator [Desulfobacterales bacterium]